MKTRFHIIIAAICTALCWACTPKVPSTYNESQEEAQVYPDYRDVTVPPNIAPLRFIVDEEAEAYTVRLSYPGGEWGTNERKAMPKVKEWHAMLQAAQGGSILAEVFVRHGEQWTRRKPFSIHVAKEEIDPYISYRLICPSYVTYRDLTINQRNLTNFDETVVYGSMMNTTAEKGQCINCHAYQNGNPSRMQFHAREGMGGTVIACDGKLMKVNLKVDSLISSGVYPAWHPKEKLIAYSVNNTGQMFHTRDTQKIEVQDTGSDLILYDIEQNQVSLIKGDKDDMECYPWWSPDGNHLYYVSAHFEIEDTAHLNRKFILQYKDIKYSIFRRPFNAKTRTFGSPETVFDAASQGKSATLPRISPDGRFLMFTLGEFGVFHIWHKDADLYLMDLKNGSIRAMNEINSPDVESYHSWSTNGRWVIFSSRRNDGNFTRPFIAYIDKHGHGSKPFELPQADPEKHRRFMRSYNIPEFMTGPVEVTPQEFASFIRNNEAVSARMKD